jgi:hypothetical protein
LRARVEERVVLESMESEEGWIFPEVRATTTEAGRRE